MIRKCFKYRCYPNKGTKKRAIRAMRAMAQIWNIALNERVTSYEAHKKDETVKPVNSYYSQYHLIRKKDHPEYSHYPAKVMQCVLMTLDGSYKSFFALNKKGDPDARPPGPTDFHRYLVFHQSGWKVEGDILNLSRIGRFKVKLHREIEGKIKAVTISLDRGLWYACFSCECQEKDKINKRKTVKIRFDDDRVKRDGQDYNVFCRDNRGGEFIHPEFYSSEMATLERLSQSLSRKKRGSKNRRKAKWTLRKWHDHIANRRKYYIESIVDHYVKNYACIELEKLPSKINIQYAITSEKARKLCDASYAMFTSKLKNKCKEYQINLTEFKDEEKWENQIRTATEIAKLEQLQKALRKGKKALKYQNPVLLESLKKDLKTVPTLVA